MKSLFLTWLFVIVNLVYGYSQMSFYEFGARSKGVDNSNSTLSDEWSIFNNVGYSATSMVSYQTRVQHSHVKVNEKNTSGVIIAQDFNVKMPRYSISSRVAFFNSDDYDN